MACLFGVCMFMHLHVENRGQRQVVYHPPFGEGGRASHWPGAPSRLDCTVSSNGLPVSVFLVLGLRDIYHHTWLSLHWFWGPNSVPHSKASMLLTKPSPEACLVYGDSLTLYPGLPWTCGILSCINKYWDYRHELPRLSRISFGVS